MSITLAIIGTAGRGEDRYLLSAEHYTRMTNACVKMVGSLRMRDPDIQLVSGGAAWADHLVVTLGIGGVVDPKKITLYLPCPLTATGFKGTNKSSDKTADTINHYHDVFGKMAGFDSIYQLGQLSHLGSEFIVGNGFKGRNSLIAEAVSPAGVLLAFTFGNAWTWQDPWSLKKCDPGKTAREAGLKTGGTSDTYNKALCERWHARLGSLDHEWENGYAG